MPNRDDFRSSCEYYGRKCRKRLYRTRLSHHLALDHLGEVAESGRIEKYGHLISESLEGDEQGEHAFPGLRQKLVKTVVESHFLTLKVNFEFFLSRMLHCLWFYYFDELVRSEKKGRLTQSFTLREFALALSRQGGKEYVIDRIVPAHGLGRMAECFKETTGIAISDRLNASNPTYWAQIHSAFEVRHLIEHRKGKVDQRFLDEVASLSLWQHSSWADFPLGHYAPSARAEATEAATPLSAPAARIAVREKDFEATFVAMVESAALVTAVTIGAMG